MRNILRSESVKLTSIKEGDEAILEKWFDDVEFMRNYDMLPAFLKGKKGIEELLNYYSDNTQRCLLGVRLSGENRLVGIAGYDDIIWSNGTAYLFIGIGDLELRGKGIGKEALNLLIDYGFNELNFHKIQLNVIEYNKRAIFLYEKTGFVKEGIYREYIYRDGRRYHMYLYGLLKGEWKTDV